MLSKRDSLWKISLILLPGVQNHSVEQNVCMKKKQPLFSTDDSKLKWKQASHITKQGWGVRNGEKLLNKDWNKILLGVMFFMTRPHARANEIFVLDKFSSFWKIRMIFFPSLSKQVEVSLVLGDSADYFFPFSLAWFATVQEKCFCEKIKHDERGKKHILFDNAFLADRYFSKYIFQNNKIFYQPLDLEVLESLYWPVFISSRLDLTVFQLGNAKHIFVLLFTNIF